MFEKYMCWCSTGGSDLQKGIAAAGNKIPEVEAAIKELEAQVVQLKADIKSAQADRVAAKSALAEATSLREKEAAAFAAEKAESDANIGAMSKALAALEKGMGGAFLQTNAAKILRNLMAKVGDVIDDDQQAVVTSFLSGEQGEDYAPASGQIVGILKQMKDTMSADLEKAVAEEEDSIKAFKDLVAAKEKEVEALTEEIESKTVRSGEKAVEGVNMKNDLDDTAKGMLEDKKFLATLEKDCKTKEAEWAEVCKTRAEELVALADTIKILNDDDALDLFKKTLPSAGSSFLQVQVSAKSMRDRAVSGLRHALRKVPRNQRANLDFLVLALTGKGGLKSGGFEKVLGMIDGMIANLKEEQVVDDEKKAYCTKELDEGEDSVKSLERAISDEKAAIANVKEGLATSVEEIESLTAGIKSLDQKVAEATEQRKEENVEYKELMASDTAAKELLGFAKNRLNKFYNPGAAPAAAASFVQIRMHQEQKEAPPPPPETASAYKKKSGESTGVIAMIDMLIRDLDKEMTEAKTEEKNAQADYEAMMKDSAEKRTTDSEALANKEAMKADLEAELEAP